MPIIEMMKTVIFVFADFDSKYAFEPVFGGKCAFGSTMESLAELDSHEIFVLAGDGEFGHQVAEGVKVIHRENWTAHSLVSFMAQNTVEEDNAIFTFGWKPFLSTSLAKKIMSLHVDYLSEYSFAEGYSNGFGIEVFNGGTLKIIQQLLETENYSSYRERKVTENLLHEIVEKDINSYEVESVLSDEDYRMLRLDFTCSSRQNFLSCRELEKMKESENVGDDPEKLNQLASKSTAVQKTVPSFYCIQITDFNCTGAIYNPCDLVAMENASFMDFQKFSALVDDIAGFSEDAVVSLSLFGEAGGVPELEKYVEKILSYSGLSVLIETDGVSLTRSTAEKILSAEKNSVRRTGNHEKIYWLVQVDAVDENQYMALHRGAKPGDFQKVLETVSFLASGSDQVYPQWTRMNENEETLENFYRFYSDRNSVSKGKVVIQKYATFCSRLPQRKSADLTPLERIPCWHLKRDMTILLDGSVPLCSQCAFCNEKIGNVFQEKLSDIFEKSLSVLEKHLNGEYENCCRDCDEYYTFNF